MSPLVSAERAPSVLKAGAVEILLLLNGVEIYAMTHGTEVQVLILHGHSTPESFVATVQVIGTTDTAFARESNLVNVRMIWGVLSDQLAHIII